MAKKQAKQEPRQEKFKKASKRCKCGCGREYEELLEGRDGLVEDDDELAAVRANGEALGLCLGEIFNGMVKGMFSRGLKEREAYSIAVLSISKFAEITYASIANAAKDE